jgi:hypothetical protein
MKNKGISIIELLVATVVAILVIDATIMTYTSVKKSYSDINDEVDKNVKAITVQQLFDSAVNNIGFACYRGSIGQTFSDVTGDSISVFSQGPISVGPMPIIAAFLPSTMKSNCSGATCYEAGSDYLMIQRDRNVGSVDNVNNNDITITGGTLTSDLEVGNYMVTCSSSEYSLLKISSASNGVYQFVNSPNVFSDNQYVGDYELSIYFTRANGLNDSEGNPIISLYAYVQSKGSGLSYELVEGVSNLQIKTVTKAAILLGQAISWQAVLADTKLDNTYEAIQISYDIDGKTFTRMFPLEVY